MSDTATESKLTDSLARSKALIQNRDFKGAYDVLNRARKDQLEGAPLDEQEDLYYSMGVCFNGMERPAEALAQFSRSLALAEQLKDASAQARSLEEIGGAHHQRGDFRSAQAFYERGHKLYTQLGDKPGQARGLRNLAGAKVDQGLATAAVDDYKAARVLFGEVGDTEGIATCVTNLALLTYRHQGRQATIEEYKRQLEVGDCAHFLVYNNIGFLLLLDEQLDEARKYLSLGVDDCKARKVLDDNIGLLYLNLGILDTLQGKYAEADDLYRQASEVFVQYPLGRAVEVVLLPKIADENGQGRFFVTEDGHKLAVTFLNTAVSAANDGDLELGLDLARKAVDLDKEQAYPLAVLGWIHRARKEDQAAAAAFQRAVGREPRNEQFKKFLELVNPYLGQKVGRNDPCPCGSGKKFKKCHGDV